MDERAERAKAEAARAREESATIAYADIGDYARLIGDEQIHDALAELPQAKRAAIKEIKVDARGRVQIKLYDKQRELQKIERREGMIASQQEQNQIVAILEARLANHSIHSDDPQTEDQAFPACDEGAWK